MVIEIRQSQNFTKCCKCTKYIQQGELYLYSRGIGKIYEYCRFCAKEYHSWNLKYFDDIRPQSFIGYNYDHEKYGRWEKLKFNIYVVN